MTTDHLSDADLTACLHSSGGGYIAFARAVLAAQAARVREVPLPPEISLPLSWPAVSTETKIRYGGYVEGWNAAISNARALAATPSPESTIRDASPAEPGETA